MKINNLIEEIFSHAVAMDQSGGMRNTIYCIGTEIFIMNYDHTVLIRFGLRRSENNFETPISFRANDYDSNCFEQVDDRIIFTNENENFIRKKTCGTPDLSPEEIQKIFNKYVFNSEDSNYVEEVLSGDILELLDDNLSHVEFYGERRKTLTLIQRNIYSGGIIEIEKKSGGLFSSSLKRSFGPIAVKTTDFKALYSFQKSIKFWFPTDSGEFILFSSTDVNKRNMTGLVSCCIYDEIIKLQEAKRNGRQKQKRRRRE